MSRIHWVISHARLGCEQVTLGQDIACKAGVGAGHIGSDHMQSLGGSRSHWVRRSHAKLGWEQVTLGQEITCKAGVGAGHIGSGDHVRLGWEQVTLGQEIT